MTAAIVLSLAATGCALALLIRLDAVLARRRPRQALHRRLPHRPGRHSIDSKEGIRQ